MRLFFATVLVMSGFLLLMGANLYAFWRCGVNNDWKPTVLASLNLSLVLILTVLFSATYPGWIRLFL